MQKAVIAATGLFTPPFSVSNSELVDAFNTYVERFNAAHAEAIAAGEVTALAASSPEFIEKASGIKARYVMNKSGIVDPEVMRPILPERPNEQISGLTISTALALPVAMKSAAVLIPKVADEQATFMSKAKPSMPSACCTSMAMAG